VIGEPVWRAEKDRRRLTIGRSVLFGVALLLGAVALAGMLGALGSALVPRGSTPVTVVVGIVAGAVILRETIGRRIPVPGTHWQVPRRWLRHYWAGAAAFGWIMGMGIFTRQRSALFHLYLVGCLVGGGLGTGIIFGLVFGIIYLTVFLRGTLVAARSKEGDGVFSDWATSARRRIRWVGVVAAPLVLLVPL
jgi:hypothetical protein